MAVCAKRDCGKCDLALPDKEVISAYESVLDLINRQKAEIEDLKSQMEWLTGYNGNLLDANTALSGEIEICKSEAIKEFAMRLKDGVPQETGVIRCADVDNLVKEMTEVEECMIKLWKF